jgi:hypothetical protein
LNEIYDCFHPAQRCPVSRSRKVLLPMFLLLRLQDSKRTFPTMSQATRTAAPSKEVKTLAPRRSSARPWLSAPSWVLTGTKSSPWRHSPSRFRCLADCRLVPRTGICASVTMWPALCRLDVVAAARVDWLWWYCAALDFTLLDLVFSESRCWSSNDFLEKLPDVTNSM